MLSLMAILPGSLIAAHAQAPSVFLDPAVNAADVGGMFTVNVMASDVGMLVGYDVIVTYDNTILSAASANFNAAPDVFAGMNSFSVNAYCSDAIGQCQSTQTLLGGATVDLSASTGQLYSITFQVLSASPTTIDISLANVAADVGGSIESVSVTTTGASFSSPPVLSLVYPYATVPKAAFHLIKGTHDTQVTISAMLIYNSSNVRAGFGGVIFDVIDPNGGDTAVQSNIMFFLTPGSSGTVSAVYPFSASGNALGRYSIIVTLLRCADPNTCVTGQVASSPTFFMVKA